MKTKTHWKKLTNPNYLGSWDFEENEERVLVIKSVSQDTVKDQNGKDDEVVLMEFTTGKPMILNKTNLKAVEKSTETAFIEEWTGKQVTLFTTRIRAFGEDVDALRISPAKTKPKQKAGLNDKRFEDALKAIKAGTFTAETLKQKYSLTKEQEAKL